jgi:hypothetical protein
MDVLGEMTLETCGLRTDRTVPSAISDGFEFQRTTILFPIVYAFRELGVYFGRLGEQRGVLVKVFGLEARGVAFPQCKRMLFTCFAVLELIATLIHRANVYSIRPLVRP